MTGSSLADMIDLLESQPISNHDIAICRAASAGQIRIAVSDQPLFMPRVLGEEGYEPTTNARRKLASAK